MTMVIAVCGKGGVGKTTVSSLIIKSLLDKGRTPVLAVDADPNSNLAPALGITPEETLGQVLEQFHGTKLNIPSGLTKAAYLELRINQALVEEKGYDVLVMGRPEGPGCYCSANSILRDTLERLVNNYEYVVMDNEAGMEHLSRRTANRIDVLLMVTDPSMKGMRTVGTLFDLVREIELPVVKKYVTVSRASQLDPRLKSVLDELPGPLLGLVEDDDAVKEYDLDMRSFLELPADSSAVVTVGKMVDKVLAEWGQ